MTSTMPYFTVGDAVAGMDEMCDRGPDLLTDADRIRLLTECLGGNAPLDRPTSRINNDRTVAVATEVFWNEDMTTCPRSVKVQLLGAGGVAAYGQWNGNDSFWVGWVPVPARRPR